MESRSDISSLSSKRSVDNHIPSIHVDQYLFDQHAKKISSLHESESGKSFPRIFTVAQTLKDPLILNHIKPDYGSLGEFIGDLNIGRDLLNQKKRKNEGNEDEAEEKKIKNIFKEKNQQQLNNAFLNKSSPSVYKKVAGKLLVQNLFKESFGVSLNAFQNQNVKQEPLKGFKFSLSYFDEIFEGRKQLPKKIQQQVQVNQQYSGDSTERKQQEKLSTRSIKILPQRQRLQLINQIKSKYNSLKKLQIKKDCQQYKKLLPKQASQDNWTESNLHHSHYDQEQERKKNEKSIQHIMQITEASINFQKFTIKPELMLFFMSQFGLQKIQSICLNQIRINQQTLCFMLELVKEVCQNLEKLTIKCLSIEKLQNFAIKIKEILQTTSLKELVLEYLDMDTKQFCMICLGVGSNTSLQLLNFDNNAVDERGCKSLELISKHCQNLKKISLKKNYLKPHHLSYFPAEAKSKIML